MEQLSEEVAFIARTAETGEELSVPATGEGARGISQPESEFRVPVSSVLASAADLGPRGGSQKALRQEGSEMGAVLQCCDPTAMSSLLPCSVWRRNGTEIRSLEQKIDLPLRLNVKTQISTNSVDGDR